MVPTKLGIALVHGYRADSDVFSIVDYHWTHAQNHFE